jgi:hypothetical protein
MSCEGGTPNFFFCIKCVLASLFVALPVLACSIIYSLMLLQIYDMPESQVKLNDVGEFIGVYTFDPELAAPNDNSDDIMFDLIEDVTAQLPPSKVCLLQSAY